MAIFLIKDSDAVNANPDKDRMCYKRGDIVEVYDDDKKCVIPPAPPFLIVKVAGLSKAEALGYMDEHTVTSDFDLIKDAHGVDVKMVPKVLTRRRYRLPLDSLTGNIARKLRKYRYYEVEWDTIRVYLEDKGSIASTEAAG